LEAGEKREGVGGRMTVAGHEFRMATLQLRPHGGMGMPIWKTREALRGMWMEVILRVDDRSDKERGERDVYASGGYENLVMPGKETTAERGGKVKNGKKGSNILGLQTGEGRGR